LLLVQILLSRNLMSWMPESTTYFSILGQARRKRLCTSSEQSPSRISRRRDGSLFISVDYSGRFIDRLEYRPIAASQDSHQLPRLVQLVLTRSDQYACC